MTKSAPEPQFPPDPEDESDSPLKSATGRPSEYDSAYCDMLISFMAKGHSLTAFSYKIRVAPNTVKAWAKAHPEFAEAIEIGRAGRVKRVETTLNKEGKALTAPMAATGWKILTNIAPDEYRDKVTVDLGSGDTSQKALEDLRDSFKQIAASVGARLETGQKLIASSVIDVDSELVIDPHTDGIDPHTDDTE